MALISTAASFRRLPFAVTLVVLGVFAAFVVVVTLRLRSDLQHQVLAREAESLMGVVRLQQRLAEEEWMALGMTQPDEDRFSTLLLTTRLRGVLALRLYDPTGQLRSALPSTDDAMLPLQDWTRLEQGEAFARLGRNQPVIDLIEGRDPDLISADRDAPAVLEVIVPLEEPVLHELGGAAQYLMDGEPTRAEFARIDRGLIQQGLLAVAGGGVLIAGLLIWAFSRLGEANRQLQARSEDLARANHELMFAAKTSAVGAISAHLIHGLNNPLAGLEGFVRAGPSAVPDGDGGGDAWQAAAETTRRLRAMVNEVVSVLRDETAGLDLSVTADELIESVQGAMKADSARAGVALKIESTGAAILSGRTANLAGLVLRNLVANAIEASGSGKTVAVSCVAGGAVVDFSVSDEGSGLTDAVRHSLFQPLTSTKVGGGGIGLALSHQLARHAGGQLELVSSSAAGTVFRLSVPTG